MSSRKTKQGTARKATRGPSTGVETAVVIALVFSMIAIAMSAFALLASMINASNRQVQESALEVDSDPYGSFYCDLLLDSGGNTSPPSGANVSLPEFERCREVSPEMFQEVLTHEARRANWHTFSSDQPFHLWWQGRIIVAGQIGSGLTREYFAPRGASDNVRGVTEMRWGNCSDFPYYPNVSLTTVVVYPCSYLGGNPPYKVLIYELKDGQWVTDYLVYEDPEEVTTKLHYGQDFGSVNRVMCLVQYETWLAYGYEQETLETLCGHYRR